MKVLICGSRGWKDPDPINTLLAGLEIMADGKGERLQVVHGGARGADTLAGSLAAQWGAEVIEVPADWDKYGKGAGPIRNKKMLDDHNIECVYAFRTTGKSAGTDNMVEQATARGIPTYVIERSGGTT